MSGGKKKKGDSWGSGQISFGKEGKFSLSIGDVVGKPALPSVAADCPAKGDTLGSKKEQAGYENFLASASQATLHRETAGRGGKAVVMVGIKPSPDEKAALALARAMRKGLGCGAHVEDGRVVLHGDIKDRAAAWLSNAGVRNVVMGN
jgi:translation initiation factor 1 (eIF-1/SUI1)